MPNPEILRILQKLDHLTEEELREICAGLPVAVSYGPAPLGDVVHTRASLELIRAIRRFDATSTELINTTNSLTDRIRKLTIWGLAIASLGMLSGIASLIISIIVLMR